MDLTVAPPGGWPTPDAAYVHVPFCRHRCGYCNFSVIADRDELIDRYLGAIDLELQALRRPLVSTVFLGGGTPTHLPNAKLAVLLEIIANRFQFDQNIEWSIEANPEDITRDKVELLAAHGVNRVSLGVQSFHQEKLQLLERGHSGKVAANAIELVADRIKNVSLDLIFGAPGESVEQWRSDVTTAVELPIRHLSTYALTFEKGTQFWNRRLHGTMKEVDEGDEVEMYNVARALTREAGLVHYEISNFGKPDFQCLHNLSYWQGVGWYAAGPGAARFVDGVRSVNHRSTTNYLRRIETGNSPTAEQEEITLEQYARERAAFGIRMVEGIDLKELGRAVGIDLVELCRSAIEDSLNEGLVALENQRMLKLTQRGILFADTVASRLLG